MTYASKIDEMIGKHVAEFQAELSLARELDQSLVKQPMPYGYPESVYRPFRGYRLHEIKHFIEHTGGTLSNAVPRVLSMEIVGDYPLGIYNPFANQPGRGDAAHRPGSSA